MLNSVFWMILGLGIAIPFTVVAFFNISIKIKNPDSYDLNLGKLAVVYTLALLGWALVFGIRG